MRVRTGLAMVKAEMTGASTWPRSPWPGSAHGSRIAARLVAACHEVIVWNRSAD